LTALISIYKNRKVILNCNNISQYYCCLYQLHIIGRVNSCACNNILDLCSS